MRLALIYDPECPKLRSDAYSQTYRDMFLSLASRYEHVQYVTESCSAQDIEADHIVFFDIHSSHHVEIDGIEKHSAVKFEYFNDPHQQDQVGQYRNGPAFHKLGAAARCRRANARGVKYAICPYTSGYYRYLAPHFDGELLWFPVAPRPRLTNVPLLEKRRHEVLANGHTWPGQLGFRPYKFRFWAHAREDVTVVEHVVFDPNAVHGESYQSFLSQYAGALALCDTYVVPKYSEVPLAGCLCFAQYQYEYEQMGFKDGESCIYVTKKNFRQAIEDFKQNVNEYQQIATRGRELILNHWTAKHFAEAIHGHHER